MAEFVQYNDEKHRKQFIELNIEYISWVRDEVKKRYGRDLSLGSQPVKEYVEEMVTKYTEAKQPDGIVYLLEVEGKVAGMGALKKLEEGVAEVKRMYIRSEYRGHGYGGFMLGKLIEAAKMFGYSILRLDTAEFMASARRIYESAGFKVRGPYSGTEVTPGSGSSQIFMEKKL
jgi:GNAT superfamily N-acetyltransferase